MKRSIVWKFLGAYILLILIAIVVLGFFVDLKFRDHYEKNLSETLRNEAVMAGDILKDALDRQDREAIQDRTNDLAKILGIRVTVIDKTGSVLGDSETDPASMENHIGREEVASALSDGVGESSRFSKTLRFNMKYVAVAVRKNGNTTGIIRFSMPLVEVERELSIINRVIFLGGFLVVLITLMIGYFISKKISGPIRNMERTTRSIAKGDLSRRVDIRSNDELGGLARSFNLMADELQSKIDNLNKMDKIRTDFVANVSHELKTPLTSIKGFIETLEDGAIDDKENAKKFLNIIGRHAERLSTIINDLLSLAEIEGGRTAIELTMVDIRHLLDEVVWGFGHALSEKKQKLNVEYKGTDFKVKGNKDKIEQVLVNLIDNAIKYTPQEGNLRISLFEQKENVMISIEDTGIGIPEEHLDRIFERFYRVDKARSRELGGTGLGLSIVKHIIMLHNGHIDIDSKVGKGTKITIVLPK